MRPLKRQWHRQLESWWRLLVLVQLVLRCWLPALQMLAMMPPHLQTHQQTSKQMGAQLQC